MYNVYVNDISLYGKVWMGAAYINAHPEQFGNGDVE